VVGWLERWAQRNRTISRVRASALCRRDAPITTNWQAIGWWEARRIPFNLIIGGVGVFTCVVDLIIATAAHFLFNSDFGIPNGFFALVVVLVYGVMANFCFTGGWIAELIVRQTWPQEADRFATLSFSLGLVFSVFLTLTPAVMLIALGGFALLGRVLGVAHRGG
jgi:hypothetical protein